MQTIRIASFSQRNKLLLSTIIALTNQPKFNFTVEESADIGVRAIDIAIVTASDKTGRSLLAKTLAAKPSIQVLYLARDESEIEPATDIAKHFMLHKHLMADLVTSLNRFSANVPTRDDQNTTPLAANLIAASAKAATPYPPAQPRLRLRALMVDSNPAVHAQLREVIESIGMKCDTAKSAAEALKQITDNTYNIIYIDATTAEMDGYQLLRDVRRYQNHKNTAVILLTSSAAPFDAVRGAQGGCDTYLVKPVALKNFYTATVTALSQNIDAGEVSSLTRDPTVTLPVPKK